MGLGDTTYAQRLRIRRAAAELTQRELAARSGVKQPQIAALERGTREPSEAVRRSLDAALKVRPSALLRVARPQVLEIIKAAGGTDPMVFGSVASGSDGPDSDVDILVTLPPTADIVTVLGLQADLAALLTVPVDVISSGSSGSVIERALAEAIPL